MCGGSGHLRGEGSADTLELTPELAAHMLGAARVDGDLGAARARRQIRRGAALEARRRVVALRGSDPWGVDDPSRLPWAPA